MDRLEIGKIINTHGLRGEVKVSAWTDNPEVFEDIKTVYAARSKEESVLTVENIKYQKNNLILKFRELNSIEEAQLFKNAVLTADRSVLPPLPEGIYYIVDLLGCEVFNETGVLLGTLNDVFPAGAGNVYTVKRNDGRDLLLPANNETIISIDINSKRINIRVLDGLED